MTFRRVWGAMRVWLFVVWFISVACTAFISVCAMALGDSWPITIIFVTCVIGFVIQVLERRAGWVDEQFHWIKHYD